ncbi:MAG: Wzt carbohydrate-binding domain-containing protein [Bdellovibrionota bacterium]
MFALLHDLARCLIWLMFVACLLAYSEMTQAAFTVSNASTSEEVLDQGATQSASVAIESNAEMNDVNVQVSVVDATRRVVAKQAFNDKSFRAGDTKTFKAKFPTTKFAAGTYTLTVSIFGPNWTPTFHFEDDLAKFNVVIPTKALKSH